MVYIVAKKEVAAKFGFVLKFHRTNSSQVLLNSKEIVVNQKLSGTFEERVAEIGGEVFNEKDMLHQLNEWLRK